MKTERDTSTVLEVVKRIFEFDNYRQFLKEYFREQKEIKAAFSHRYFARKAGFSSVSFCAHLISGRRNITEKSISKLIKAIGLKGKAALYFENLVLFNQAKTHAEREHYYAQLNRVRKKSKFYKLNEKQFPLFHEWYYMVLKDVAVYSNWKGEDYKALGAKVRPPLGPEVTEHAMGVLLDSGVLVKKKNGSYAHSETALSAAKVPHTILQHYKKQNLLRALDATESMGKEERHVSSATVSMSEQTYNKATQLIDETRKKIMEMALDDAKVNKVYQINFQAFPLSEDLNP